jgi:curved DNA-binding protein CbpA
MSTSLLTDTSLYEILEVSPRARPAVIKAAYRSLVLEYHPDRNGGDPAAAERMAVINNAYAVLADPLQRAQYDQRLGIPAGERRGSGRNSSPTRTDAGKGRAALRRFAFRPLE